MIRKTKCILIIKRLSDDILFSYIKSLLKKYINLFLHIFNFKLDKSAFIIGLVKCFLYLLRENRRKWVSVTLVDSRYTLSEQFCNFVCQNLLSVIVESEVEVDLRDVIVRLPVQKSTGSFKSFQKRSSIVNW